MSSRRPVQLLFTQAAEFFGQERVDEHDPHVVSLWQQCPDPAAGSSMGMTGGPGVGKLPFAALRQLLGPMLAGVERLPGPQREALQTAFGISAGAALDRFLLGLAALGLLSDTSAASRFAASS
jgi:hypothetical protein